MLLHIGDKVVNRQKIYHLVDQVLELRSKGLSQQEVAHRLGIDRTVISRLESAGEVRKGGRIALLGFPISNRQQLETVAAQEGVDYVLLLTERERWEFVESKSGLQLFNDIMEIIATLQRCDVVIILGSNMRIKLLETLLDKEVIGVQIGESPIAEDKYVDPEEVRRIIRQVQR